MAHNRSLFQNITRGISRATNYCIDLVQSQFRNDTSGLYSALSEKSLSGDDIWFPNSMPCVPSIPRSGSLDLENPIHIADKERLQTYGRIFGSYEGPTPVMLVYDPEIIPLILNSDSFFERRVFICDHKTYRRMIYITGDRLQWQKLRATFDFLESQDKLEKIVPDIARCAKLALDRIEVDEQGNGTVADGVAIFGVFSVDLMFRITYKKPITIFRREDKIIRNIAKLLQRDRDLLWNNVCSPGNTHQMYCPYDLDAMKFIKKFSNRVYQLTETDSMLYRSMLDQLDSHEMSSREMYGQITTLLAFPYAWISMTLSAACWEISQNENIQNRLRAEIDSCLINHREFNLPCLGEMTYLEQVLKEVMRKYPATARIERVCNENTIVGSIRVRKGTALAIPVYALNYDPSIYTEPEVFDPERFSDGSWGTPFQYMPFGEGSRKCPTWQFAMSEMKICMAYTLCKYILVAPEDTTELSFNVINNIMVPGEIPFGVRERDDAVWINHDFALPHL